MKGQNGSPDTTQSMSNVLIYVNGMLGGRDVMEDFRCRTTMT
jgi:hypothetical protein